jgi:hypothetical protein
MHDPGVGVGVAGEPSIYLQNVYRIVILATLELRFLYQDE